MLQTIKCRDQFLESIIKGKESCIRSPKPLVNQLKTVFSPLTLLYEGGRHWLSAFEFFRYLYDSEKRDCLFFPLCFARVGGFRKSETSIECGQISKIDVILGLVTRSTTCRCSVPFLSRDVRHYRGFCGLALSSQRGFTCCPSAFLIDRVLGLSCDSYRERIPFLTSSGTIQIAFLHLRWNFPFTDCQF